jgi:hypothetical protein
MECVFCINNKIDSRGDGFVKALEEVVTISVRIPSSISQFWYHIFCVPSQIFLSMIFVSYFLSCATSEIISFKFIEGKLFDIKCELFETKY